MRSLALTLAVLVCAPLSAEPYMGIGGSALPQADQIEDFAQMLLDAGLNHVQMRVQVSEPDIAERVAYLQERGVTVYGYDKAFLGIRGERDDYQVRADGSIKEGTVCPRSQRRIAEMIEVGTAMADTGVDGIVWDFITVESRTMEACFCEECVAAFNEAAGTDYDREELVAALREDEEALQTWRSVRRESTNEAMRRVTEAIHEHRPEVQVGGYVIMPGNDLGSDTVGLAGILDVLAPMIYQARSRADVGWMREKLEVFTQMPGDARVIECVDTGFYVDQPVEELINTTRDCHRAGIDGWALWPYGKVSSAEMAGVAAVPMLARRFHEPLQAGRVDEAREGLVAVLDEARRMVVEHGSAEERAALEELFDGAEPVGALREAVEHCAALPGDDEAAATVARVLHLRADAARHRLHESDVRYTAGQYQVTFSEVAREVTVSGPGWTATQDRLALNIDRLQFEGLLGDASTDPHDLGLLRTRVNGIFDPWGSTADVEVTQEGDAVEVSAVCTGRDCLLGRTWTIRGGEPWMSVDVFVENSGDERREGRLWVWNGIGIPGFLEANSQEPWQDDAAQVLDENILVVRDEGRFVAIGADPGLWEIPEPGRAVSNLFHELTLQPGERFTTRLYLAIGAGADDRLPGVVERYPGQF